MRLTRDPFCLNARLASGRWFYRFSHAFIYRLPVRASARPRCNAGASAIPGGFSACCKTRAWMKLTSPDCCALLPAGDSELYSHPSLDEFKNEFDALVSARVKAAVDRLLDIH